MEVFSGSLGSFSLDTLNDIIHTAHYLLYVFDPIQAIS